MDLVYIVREGDENNDLRYSLRSVAKFVPYDNIWIVGYKPKWVQNVNYLPVKQNRNKWNNSVKNIYCACKCEEISDNFVLMNDDFFAIKPIKDLHESINVTLGRLDDSIRKHRKLNSRWGNAFAFLEVLLRKLNLPRPYYDYESHIPLEINKEKYLKVMDLPEVLEYRNTNKVLHKRSLYKNYYESTNPTILSDDVKIEYDSEVPKKIQICDWLSVYDNQVANPSFTRLNYFLQNLFPEKCEFEADNYKPVKLPRLQEPIKRIVRINPDGTRTVIEEK